MQSRAGFELALVLSTLLSSHPSISPTVHEYLVLSGFELETRTADPVGHLDVGKRLGRVFASLYACKLQQVLARSCCVLTLRLHVLMMVALRAVRISRFWAPLASLKDVSPAS